MLARMKLREFVPLGLALLLILGALAWLAIAAFHFWMSSGPPIPQPRDVFAERALIDLAVAFVILAGMLVWYGIAPTWGVFLLPYLEQQNLYNKFNPKVIFNLAPNNTDVPDPTLNPAANSVKVYNCPSSPSNGVVYQDTWDNSGDAYGPYSGNPSWTVSASDYIAISGMLGRFVNNYFPVPDHNGVLNDNFQVSIKMIADGLTNTWMVGECGGASSRPSRG